MASYLVGLLKQPSTYAGLGTFLAMTGIHFTNPDTLPNIVQFLTAAASLAAVFLNEQGASK